MVCITHAIGNSFMFANALSALQLDLPGTPFWKAKRAKAYILERIAGRVAAKRDAMLAAGPRGQRSTLLEHYMGARLADGDDLDTHFLSMTVLMLMLAGSDTSKLSHKVLLGVLPDLPPGIVERMREEQRAVVARHGPALTRAAVNDMVWADAMAREVLRLRGPAEGLFRCACVQPWKP